MSDRETKLGIRQIDVYTGLNVLILLLELHRYAQVRDEWKDSIVFYPSGKPSKEIVTAGWTARLLIVIRYSESTFLFNFSLNLRYFLHNTYLCGAYLAGTWLCGVNFSGSDLRNTDLSRSELTEASFLHSDLSNVNLYRSQLLRTNFSYSDMTDAILVGANLTATNFTGANLTHANLKNVTWDELTNWQGVIGLSMAKNIPPELKQHLGLD
jgi:glucose-6-phosphate dehydrogenase assembly protein OpcA